MNSTQKQNVPKISNSVIEMLAEELHRQYRAAEKALNKQTHSLYRAGVLMPNENRLLHDHGWTACGKQDYFRKRAKLMIKRANVINPETLGDAEIALAANVLLRRLSVSGNIRCALPHCSPMQPRESAEDLRAFMSENGPGR